MVLQEKRVISLRKPKNWLAWHLGTVATWLLTQFKNKFLPLPQLSQLSKSRALVRSQCGVVGAQGCKQCEDCSIYCACHLGKAQAGRQAGRCTATQCTDGLLWGVSQKHSALSPPSVIQPCVLKPPAYPQPPLLLPLCPSGLPEQSSQPPGSPTETWRPQRVTV